MIRTLIWLLALSAVAVALALLGKVTDGFAIFVVAGQRIEMSFNAMVVFVGLGYGVLYLVLRAAGLLLALPERVRKHREEKARQDARNRFYGGIAAYLEGRYAEALTATKAAMAEEETRALAALIAAKSAHAQGLASERDALLADARAVDSTSDLPRLLVAADLFIKEERYVDADRALTDAIKQDRDSARAWVLKHDAARAQKQWREALAALNEIARLKGLPEARLADLKLEATVKFFGTLATAEEVFEAWRALKAPERLTARIALAAADTLISREAVASAREVLEALLDKEWHEGAAARYGDAASGRSGEATLAMIERAEAWLLQHPRDAGLLLSLGKLCLKQGLPGKARGYLEASMALSTSAGLRAEAETLLAATAA
jgi:HemY protein